MFEELYLYLIAAIPSLTTILAVVAFVYKVCKEFVALAKEVKAYRESVDLQKAENKILKKALEDMITEMRKQKYDINMDSEV